MPQIPTYEPKAGIAPVDLPAIPLSLGTSVTEAITKAGEKVFETGNKFDQQMAHKQAVADAGLLDSKAQVALNDLRNEMISSPDFIINPEAARANWQERANQIKAELAGGIQPNSETGMVFQNKWNVIYGHHEKQIANDVFAKQQDRATGGSLAAFQNFTNAAASAPNTDAVHEALHGIEGQANGGIAAGIFTYEQGQKLKQHFRDQALSAYGHNLILGNPSEVIRQIETSPGPNEPRVYPLSLLGAPQKASLRSAAYARSEHLSREALAESERAEKKAKEARVERNYTLLSRSFQGDPQGAYEFVNTPESLPNTPPDELVWLKSKFKADADKLDHDRKRLEEQNDRTIEDNFLKSAVSGRIMTEQEVVATAATPKTKTELIRMSKQRREDLFKTVPAVKADLTARIWQRQVNDPHEILQYIGNGLSPDDATEMKKTLVDARDISKSGGFTNALKMFDNKFGKEGDAPDKAMREKRAVFVTMLDAVVKKKGISDPKDILTEAEAIIQPMAKEQFLEYLDRMGDTETTAKTRGMRSSGMAAKVGGMISGRLGATVGGFIDERFGSYPTPLDVQVKTGTSPGTYAPPVPKLAPGTKKPVPSPEVQGMVDKLRSEGMSDADIAALMRGSRSKLDPANYGVKE
ncbi:MAG: hypothetical protein WAW37_14245 [Syntrophobacteraceae bacterium]